MWGMIWGRWGGDQLETKEAGEEEMERNDWASQNSQRVVELKKKNVYSLSYRLITDKRDIEWTWINPLALELDIYSLAHHFM